MTRFDPQPEYVGKTLVEIAGLREVDPVSAFMQLLVESLRMSEETGRGADAIIGTSMVQSQKNGAPSPTPPFGTVQGPIAMMEQEHDSVGEAFKKIAELSNDYTPPEEACNTYRVLYSKLKEFEEDLHLHIHLENNILFPKAAAVEVSISERA